MVEIATAEGLQEFTPDTVDFVMFKFGEGNGNTPKMLLDRFEIRPGVFPLNEGVDGSAIEIISFEFTSQAPLTATITWSSAPDETFTAQRSEDLITWADIEDGIASGGSTNISRCGTERPSSRGTLLPRPARRLTFQITSS